MHYLTYSTKIFMKMALRYILQALSHYMGTLIYTLQRKHRNDSYTEEDCFSNVLGTQYGVLTSSNILNEYHQPTHSFSKLGHVDLLLQI